MRNLFLSILIILVCTEVHASFIASNNVKLNPNQPTHILIAGEPDKIGELFLYSLLTRAKIYQEKSAQEQIIIIGRSEDQDIILNAGYKIIDKKWGLLKSNYIENSLKNLKTILSFDIYAHSNPVSGITLDSNTWIFPLLNEKDELWDKLSTKLTSSSFIFIHGCNAGIKLAPALAKKLNIAVLAALTSTDFQKIYNDSFWAFDYESKTENRSAKNKLNYSTPKSCGVFCTRMKPDNFSYRGYWGDWGAGGYPTYKLFCGKNESSRCEAGATEAILTFPGPQKYSEAKISLENFKKQLIDFMCPFASNRIKQQECAFNLERSLTDKTLKNYSPFKGKTLDCDFTICKAHFNCSSLDAAFNPDSCELINDSETDSTTFTKEYAFFVNAWNKNQK